LRLRRRAGRQGPPARAPEGAGVGQVASAGVLACTAPLGGARACDAPAVGRTGTFSSLKCSLARAPRAGRAGCAPGQQAARGDRSAGLPRCHEHGGPAVRAHPRWKAVGAGCRSGASAASCVRPLAGLGQMWSACLTADAGLHCQTVFQVYCCVFNTATCAEAGLGHRRISGEQSVLHSRSTRQRTHRSKPAQCLFRSSPHRVPLAALAASAEAACECAKRADCPRPSRGRPHGDLHTKNATQESFLRQRPPGVAPEQPALPACARHASAGVRPVTRPAGALTTLLSSKP